MGSAAVGQKEKLKCATKGCRYDVYALGHCEAHYRRNRRSVDPDFRSEPRDIGNTIEHLNQNLVAITRMMLKAADNLNKLAHRCEHTRKHLPACQCLPDE